MLGRPESAIHHRGGERKLARPWQHEPREPAPLSEGSDAAERASAGRAKAESPAPAPTRPVRSAHIYRYGSRADPRAAATAIYSIYHSIYGPVCFGFLQLLATKNRCRLPNAQLFSQLL
jgi:hypothetical protein